MYIFVRTTGYHFAIKSLKFLLEAFDNNNYISFSIGSTRSAANSQLVHHHSINNFNKHFYFTRLPHLWNAMPVINIRQSLSTIKAVELFLESL